MALHRLKEYIGALEDNGLVISCPDNISNTDISNLTYDSREVTENTLFICKGVHFDVKYLESAVASGAVAYVSEKEYGVKIPCIKVSSVRDAMPELAKIFFDDAPSKLTTVGITGTKGKSTTVYYIKSVFDGYFEKESACLSSIDNYDGVIREESHLTTPESVEFFRHCSNAVNTGLTHLVCEVSSQALKYGRVNGICFDFGCLNNIGTDHISPIEHPDFEDYFASKLKIFDTCKTGLINTDMDFYPRALEYAEKSGCGVVKYGKDKSADFRLLSVERANGRTEFAVKLPNGETESFAITMPGLFNVENALTCVAVCVLCGVPCDFIRKGLENATAPGRMELFDSFDNKIHCLVDYAHNELSFRKLYESIKSDYPDADIMTVFGCPGKKAFLRRHDLGTLSGQNSVLTVITEEDSGEEPFESISGDIAGFVKAAGGKYLVIEDRREAIRTAVMSAKKETVIAITGKGRETRMKRGTEYIETPTDLDYVDAAFKEYERNGGIK